MADDTYPEELYVDEVDVYDWDDMVWQDLLDLVAWENEQTEYDREFWEGDERGDEEPESYDDWFWNNRE